MAGGIGRRFMEETRYDRFVVSAQQRDAPQPPLGRPPGEGEERIDLPTIEASGCRSSTSPLW